MKKPFFEEIMESLTEAWASEVPKEEITAWLQARDEPIPASASEWIEANDRWEFEQFRNRENKNNKGAPFTEQELTARWEKGKEAAGSFIDKLLFLPGPDDPRWAKTEGWPSLESAVSLAEMVFWKVQKLSEDFPGKWDLQLDATGARQKIRRRLYPSTFTEDFAEGLSAGWQLARAAFVAEMGASVLKDLRAKQLAGRRRSEGAESDLKEWLKDLWNEDAKKPMGVKFVHWLVKHGADHQIDVEWPDGVVKRNPDGMKVGELDKLSFRLKDRCGKAAKGDPIRRWPAKWQKEEKTGQVSV